MITAHQHTARQAQARREAASEALVLANRHAARVARCAQGTGHVNDDGSPVCGACDHDVRLPAPVIR